jgi:hypothetical protein
MKKKSIFIAQHIVDESSGIGRKIIAQIEAFRKCGLNMELASLKIDASGKYEGRFITPNVFQCFVDYPLIKKKLQWLWRYKNLSDYIINNKIEFVYIRYTHFATPFFVNFLRVLNRKKIAVYMEIPTYPYDQEYKNSKLILKLFGCVEKITRKILYKYVSRVVTVSEHKEIFRIPAINIANGFDVSKIPNKRIKRKTESINILIVSSFEFWHGYDRLMEGFLRYLKVENNRNIKINFVGRQNTLAYYAYKKFVDENNLNEKIVFHGYQTGEKLDNLYSEADIGVGVLGGHRKGLFQLKALKSVEYCARGLPFIYSGTDISFDDKDFVLNFPNDDSPIDFIKLVNWVDVINIDEKIMRNYVAENLTWDIQMGKIVDSLMLDGVFSK